MKSLGVSPLAWGTPQDRHGDPARGEARHQRPRVGAGRHDDVDRVPGLVDITDGEGSREAEVGDGLAGFGRYREREALAPWTRAARVGGADLPGETDALGQLEAAGVREPLDVGLLEQLRLALVDAELVLGCASGPAPLEGRRGGDDRALGRLGGRRPRLGGAGEASGGTREQCHGQGDQDERQGEETTGMPPGDRLAGGCRGLPHVVPPHVKSCCAVLALRLLPFSAAATAVLVMRGFLESSANSRPPFACANPNERPLSCCPSRAKPRRRTVMRGTPPLASAH